MGFGVTDLLQSEAVSKAADFIGSAVSTAVSFATDEIPQALKVFPFETLVDPRKMLDHLPKISALLGVDIPLDLLNKPDELFEFFFDNIQREGQEFDPDTDEVEELNG